MSDEEYRVFARKWRWIVFWSLFSSAIWGAAGYIIGDVLKRLI